MKGNGASSNERVETWDFVLYVAGGRPRSLAAHGNLKALCEQYFTGRYKITVVDLRKHPERAREANIAALPTLIRKLPEPMKRIIGDLSATREVLVALGYTEGELRS
jgi:circadian clock protein KaiB